LTVLRKSGFFTVAVKKLPLVRLFLEVPNNDILARFKVG
jgi:hypothetical protein